MSAAEREEASASNSTYGAFAASAAPGTMAGVMAAVVRANARLNPLNVRVSMAAGFR